MIWRDRTGRRFESAWGFPEADIVAQTVQATIQLQARHHGMPSDALARRPKLTEQQRAEGTESVIVFSERYVQGLATKATNQRLPKPWRDHLEAVCEAVLRGKIYGEDIFRAIGFVEGVLMAFRCASKADLQALERSTSPRKGQK